MEILDRVFQVLFARMRRRLGDSNLEWAWRRASNKMAGYLAVPVGAATAVLVVVVYAVSSEGTRIEHRHWVQFIAMITGIVAIVLLNRRFRKHLSSPPALAFRESNADTRLIFWFRTISLGSFALTCVIGLLLHRAGVRFLQGL
jgi:FtsH-binding integral membrane protein